MEVKYTFLVPLNAYTLQWSGAQVKFALSNIKSNTKVTWGELNIQEIKDRHIGKNSKSIIRSNIVFNVDIRLQLSVKRLTYLDKIA